MPEAQERTGRPASAGLAWICRFERRQASEEERPGIERMSRQRSAVFRSRSRLLAQAGTDHCVRPSRGSIEVPEGQLLGSRSPGFKNKQPVSSVRQSLRPILVQQDNFFSGEIFPSADEPRPKSDVDSRRSAHFAAKLGVRIVEPSICTASA